MLNQHWRLQPTDGVAKRWPEFFSTGVESDNPQWGRRAERSWEVCQQKMKYFVKISIFRFGSENSSGGSNQNTLGGLAPERRVGGGL